MRRPYAIWIVVSLTAAWVSALWAQSPPAGADGATPPGEQDRAFAPGWPAWLEPWLFNAGERTRSGMASALGGDAGGALEPLETALRLEPEHPVARYNAGSARLGAGRGDAEALLAAAVEDAPVSLKPLVQYNLGNARLADDDFQSAIEAYAQALRLDPGFENAKFNLELARRRLEEQQQDPPQDPSPQDPPPQDQPQQDQPPQDQPPQDQSSADPPTQDPPTQDPPPQPDEDPQPREPESPLPEFRDLPDMTAEEAAAILEAIENMEREERRQDAIEAARQSHRAKKDW